MSPWHLSQKPKPEMGWDESYVFRLIFTRNQVDDQKEEVKLSSAIVRRFVTFPSSVNPAVFQEDRLWTYFCMLAAVKFQLFSLWLHSVAASDSDMQLPVKLLFSTLMLSTLIFNVAAEIGWKVNICTEAGMRWMFSSSQTKISTALRADQYDSILFQRPEGM